MRVLVHARFPSEQCASDVSLPLWSVQWKDEASNPALQQRLLLNQQKGLLPDSPGEVANATGLWHPQRDAAFVEVRLYPPGCTQCLVHEGSKSRERGHFISLPAWYRDRSVYMKQRWAWWERCAMFRAR